MVGKLNDVYTDRLHPTPIFAGWTATPRSTSELFRTSGSQYKQSTPADWSHATTGPTAVSAVLRIALGSCGLGLFKKETGKAKVVSYTLDSDKVQRMMELLVLQLPREAQTSPELRAEAVRAGLPGVRDGHTEAGRMRQEHAAAALSQVQLTKYGHLLDANKWRLGG